MPIKEFSPEEKLHIVSEGAKNPKIISKLCDKHHIPVVGQGS